LVKLKDSPPPEIILGGKSIQIVGLGARDGIEFCLVVGPYLPTVGKIIREFVGEESELQEEVLRELAHSMGEFPGDLLKLVGLLVRRKPEWIAKEASAEELFETLKVLMEVSELKKIIELGRSLGLIGEGIREWQKEQSP